MISLASEADFKTSFPTARLEPRRRLAISMECLFSFDEAIAVRRFMVFNAG